MIILNCDCNNILRLGLHYFIFRSSEKNEKQNRGFERFGFRLHIVRVIIITIGVLLAKEFWTDSRFNWLVVSTPLENMSQIGNLPQIGAKIKKCFKSPPSSRFTPLTINGWNLKTHPMKPRHGLDTL